jgi:hypothetical protein
VLTALSVSLASLLGLSVVLTLVCRAVRLPGGRPSAALLGGILAGIVLGPGILGKFAPDWYEQTFVGGVTQQRALDELRAQRQGLLAAGVSTEAVREFDRDHRAERRFLENARRKAMAAFREPLDVAAVTMMGVAFFAAAWVSPRRRRLDWVDHGQLAAVAGAAAMAVLVAAVPTTLVAHHLLRLPLPQAAALGAAVAAGSAFARLPMRWSADIGRHGSRGVGWFGGMALGLSIGLLTGVLPSDRVLWLAGPLGALAVGPVFGLASPANRHARSLARGLILVLVIPTLAAIAASRVDPALLARGWRPGVFLALAALVASDGHFIGAWLGLQTLAFGTLRTQAHRFWLEAHAAGFSLTQVCFAVLLLATGMLDPGTVQGSAGLAGILVTALVPELLLGVHRRFALHAAEVAARQRDRDEA